MTTFVRALGALLLPSLLGAAPLQAAGITPEQLLDIERVGKADISPDGSLAAYTVVQNRALEDDAGSSWSRLYVVPTSGGDARAFVTGDVKVGAPGFSPDGRIIGFTMTRGAKAKAQVWVIPVDGGEAQAATRSKTGVGTWQWSHDGAAIFYIDTEDTPAREKELKDEGWLPRYYEENLKSRLLRRVPFAFGQAPAEGEILVDGMAVWGLSVGSRGRWLLYGASPRNLVDQRYVFQDVYLLDLHDGESELVIDPPGKLGNYRLSPDGARLAWTQAASRSDHAVSSLYVARRDGSGVRNLTPDGFAGHIKHVQWRDDDTLIYLAEVGVSTTLSLQDVGENAPAASVVLRAADHGLVTAAPVMRPGIATMLMTGHSGTTPTELYRWSGRGDVERMTRHNAWLDGVELGEQRVVTWRAYDGVELQGILMLPVGYEKGRFPLIVDVHGGPESREADGWLSRYASPGQALCARGFGVFFPNYRGSTGRGIAFAAMAYGDPAGDEFHDILAGVDHLVGTGLADGDRVGVMGGSYGGYATNWLCTYHSDYFKAGVSFVGISDLVSKRFLTDIPYEDEYVHMRLPVRESWEFMLERSPVRYAERCRTPLLILHGDSDPRVHPSQSQEMYRALKMAGHPSVRLVFYPGEKHGNTRRFGRADAVYRTMAWFDHYLLEGRAWDGPMPALDLSGEMGLLEGD